ncbi:MAG: alanine--tRNA ligase [Candidatus Moranbacteria bacterium]|nr:alanine--tRNA ligase [Candidatus Moranbacteria bacterium]
MNSIEIRKNFLDFFKLRGHAILPSASLVPENDPSVLFTTAGMQPLVPYLLGERHPRGVRLANHQKCVRLTDIDEVGDPTHNTFFEMLGNWSLGDYFKKESIKWSFDFLTNNEYGLGIDCRKIYVSVFSGDKDSPLDDESIAVWKDTFAQFGIDARVFGKEDLAPKTKKLLPSYRVFLLGKEDNWWPAGGKHPGPQGPDTEIFYFWGEGEPNLQMERPGFNDEKFWEVWNNVFMEYQKNDGTYEKLAQKNVDTGMGLERACAVVSGEQDIFRTDLFAPIIAIIETESQLSYKSQPEVTRAMRIIADHLRATVMIMGDDSGIRPSNEDRGYILRKLIRRATHYQKTLNITDANQNFFEQVVRTIVDNYVPIYPELGRNYNFILKELRGEEEKFKGTLEKGLKEWKKIAKKGSISGEEAFRLFATYGFPFELTEELAAQKNIQVDRKGFKASFNKHRKISHNGSPARFAGGLVDVSPETVKLHTATHLLQAALRKVLGLDVWQKGSNINPERLRFDFSYPEKLSEEQLNQVESLVNKAIADKLPVQYSEMDSKKALQSGALGFFEDRYDEKVKVYSIGGEDTPFSKEICGGPHVKNIGELGRFKIIKEEAVSAGVRRIKAVLEN